MDHFKNLRYFLFVIVLQGAIVPLEAQKKLTVPEIGVVQDYENDSLLYAQGYKFLVESTPKLFSPITVSDQQFDKHLKKLQKLKLQRYAINLFIPAELKVVGPEVDEEAVLAYVGVVFRRAQEAGIQKIIWGSGGSRQVPDGFDRKKAKKQFIAMAKKVAESAKKHQITLVLESLNSTEGNFINRLSEALEIVKEVGHANFRLGADIYHMLKEGESPDAIRSAKGYLVYCEIAEKEGRTPPGVHAENFVPFLAALKNIGYKGNIIVECRWENVAEQGAEAYQYLQQQIDEVYRKK